MHTGDSYAGIVRSGDTAWRWAGTMAADGYRELQGCVLHGTGGGRAVHETAGEGGLVAYGGEERGRGFLVGDGVED